NRATVCPLSKACRSIVIRGEVVQFTVRPKDETLLGCAKPRRILDQSIENGLKLERRTADDLEDVGGGRLLLQRLAQIAIARLQLGKQPHVLNRDHRLVGESGQ